MISSAETSREISPLPDKPEIVVVGGGNGSSALLKGLAEHDVNVGAVVNTTDNGGSTGQLREMFPGLIGVGDIRQCMTALADNEELAEVFSRRRPDGHSLGNLMLAGKAMESGGPDRIEDSIGHWSGWLGLRGPVIPASLDSTELRLSFPLDSRRDVVGEFQIAHLDKRKLIKKDLGRLTLDPPAEINPNARDAISNADLIVLAPGNFYGSILPSLLVDGMADAINQSKGKLAMIANLTNDTLTDHFWLLDYLFELKRHTVLEPDMIIANNPLPLKSMVKPKNGFVELIAHENTPIISGDLAEVTPAEYDPNDKIAAKRSRLRHNGRAIGTLLLDQLKTPAQVA